MKKCTLHLTLFITTLLLVACGGARADEQSGPVIIREVHPTFTPTFSAPGQNVSAEAPVLNKALENPAAADAQSSDTTLSDATVPDAAAAANSAPADAGANAGTGAKVVVNTPLVNGREGPGTDYPIVEIVERGQEFDVIGASESGEWWNVCCIEDKRFWIVDEFVDTIGDPNVAILSAPTVAAPAAAPAASTPTPVAPAASTDSLATAAQSPPASDAVEAAPVVSEPAAPAPAEFDFDLKLREQFPETNVVRIFLYVFSKEGQALDGYGLRVTKDGAPLPADGSSFGPQAGFTWPVAEARQRFQNLKIEFPGQSVGGTWEVQLIDGSGAAAGPPATFELSGNDQQQELYVRYEKR